MARLHAWPDRPRRQRFVYSGYLDVPRDGVYSFHAPKEILYPSIDAGYDLRVFPGKREWYPATRWHNFGSWSVPLKRGLYQFQVVYVDQRGGGMALFGGGMNQYLKGE